MEPSSGTIGGILGSPELGHLSNLAIVALDPSEGPLPSHEQTALNFQVRRAIRLLWTQMRRNDLNGRPKSPAGAQRPNWIAIMLNFAFNFLVVHNPN